MNRKTVIAMIVSPLVGGAVFAVTVYLVLVFWEGAFWPGNDALLTPVPLIFSTFVFGIGMAYYVALFYGLPVLFIMWRFNLTKLWHAILAGVILGDTPFLVVMLNAEKGLADPYWWRGGFWAVPSMFVAFGVCGAASGLTFWLIRRRNQTSAPNPGVGSVA